MDSYRTSPTMWAAVWALQPHQKSFLECHRILEFHTDGIK